MRHHHNQTFATRARGTTARNASLETASSSSAGKARARTGRARGDGDDDCAGDLRHAKNASPASRHKSLVLGGHRGGLARHRRNVSSEVPRWRSRRSRRSWRRLRKKPPEPLASTSVATPKVDNSRSAATPRGRPRRARGAWCSPRPSARPRRRRRRESRKNPRTPASRYKSRNEERARCVSARERARDRAATRGGTRRRTLRQTPTRRTRTRRPRRPRRPHRHAIPRRSPTRSAFCSPPTATCAFHAVAWEAPRAGLPITDVPRYAARRCPSGRSSAGARPRGHAARRLADRANAQQRSIVVRRAEGARGAARVRARRSTGRAPATTRTFSRIEEEAKAASRKRRVTATARCRRGCPRRETGREDEERAGDPRTSCTVITRRPSRPRRGRVYATTEQQALLPRSGRRGAPRALQRLRRGVPRVRHRIGAVHARAARESTPRSAAAAARRRARARNAGTLDVTAAAEEDRARYGRRRGRRVRRIRRRAQRCADGGRRARRGAGPETFAIRDAKKTRSVPQTTEAARLRRPAPRSETRTRGSFPHSDRRRRRRAAAAARSAAAPDARARGTASGADDARSHRPAVAAAPPPSRRRGGGGRSRETNRARARHAQARRRVIGVLSRRFFERFREDVFRDDDDDADEYNTRTARLRGNVVVRMHSNSVGYARTSSLPSSFIARTRSRDRRVRGGRGARPQTASTPPRAACGGQLTRTSFPRPPLLLLLRGGHRAASTLAARRASSDASRRFLASASSAAARILSSFDGRLLFFLYRLHLRHRLLARPGLLRLRLASSLAQAAAARLVGGPPCAPHPPSGEARASVSSTTRRAGVVLGAHHLRVLRLARLLLLPERPIVLAAKRRAQPPGPRASRAPGHPGAPPPPAKRASRASPPFAPQLPSPAPPPLSSSRVPSPRGSPPLSAPRRARPRARDRKRARGQRPRLIRLGARLLVGARGGASEATVRVFARAFVSSARAASSSFSAISRKSLSMGMTGTSSIFKNLRARARSRRTAKAQLYSARLCAPARFAVSP